MVGPDEVSKFLGETGRISVIIHVSAEYGVAASLKLRPRRLSMPARIHSGIAAGRRHWLQAQRSRFRFDFLGHWL